MGYRLVKAHHPTKFEKGVYSVHFAQQGKPLVDRYSKHFLVRAKSRKAAIRKARGKL